MMVGKELGPFRIESELGSGAMGYVYRAVRRDTGQLVAIKVIADMLLGNETAVKRFEREGDILKQLKHPNIVRFIGTGSYRKTPFFIMEYVEGDSLDRVLVRRGAFPWNEVVSLGKQLCKALQHAHEKGIIHRDLKPSNLMLLKDGGPLKLTDFGIAKSADVTALTGANCTVGTAAYMSPEQCKGEKTISAKSDLYSMGVVFYELLTGHKPFQADSPIEMFNAHVYKSFERPSRTVMDIPVWLDTLVCQLLEKKPEHRPYDAAMVAKVLDEVEQKVADLRSAGVDAATARTTDRGSKRPADETDRAAARTLRGAVAKKKVRKKTVPLGERKWVQAVMLLAGLGGLASALYFFTRPKDEAEMYRRAKAAVESHDPDQAIEATERYLSRFGSEEGRQVNEVRDWNRAAWTQRREQQLYNRFAGKLNLPPEDDGQKLAFQAFKRENAGELKEAEQLWRDLEDKYKGSAEPEPAVYAWVAHKKLVDLAANVGREKQLQAALDREHSLGQPDRKDELIGLARPALEAFRFEQFGDLTTARDRWERIRTENLKETNPADRGWVVLAAYHAAQMRGLISIPREKEKEERLKLLQNCFDKASAIPATADPSDLKQAVSIYRDLRDLYGNDPDPTVNAFAQKARQRLAELKRS
jgi:tRNA A-37 threonylcarbamoyl transferase component Bud32